MNDKYIAQAATQEEAIQQGLDALGITRAEAKITVEEPGKKGFLGIGQKDAIIVVERKEKVNLIEDLLNNELDIDREQSQPILETEAKPAEEPENADSSVTEEEFPKAKAEAEEEQASVEELLEGRNPAEVELVKEDEEATEQADESSRKPEAAADDAKAAALRDDQEAINRVRQYLTAIIQAMSIADVAVYTSRVDNNVKYDIETENAGLVIGRHGKVLNGLQTLAQNHMHQLAHSKINVRVDAEKYRERRRNTVEHLAERTADKVLQTNQRVQLDPMPAHERKQIHRYLNQNPKVKTHSEGREPNRYLVVEPADD